jgi:hypothetical protein
MESEQGMIDLLRKISLHHELAYSKGKHPLFSSLEMYKVELRMVIRHGAQ